MHDTALRKYRRTVFLFRHARSSNLARKPIYSRTKTILRPAYFRNTLAGSILFNPHARVSENKTFYIAINTLEDPTHPGDYRYDIAIHAVLTSHV